MSNIIILINTAKHPYHTALNHMIQNFLQSKSHTTITLDISSGKRSHEYLDKINAFQPDAVITLDLSGFQFRTQAGETALNMLTTRNLNLIWGNKAEYAPFLHKKLSLSMLFYDVTGVDNQLPKQYPNLLYYKALSPISCTPAFASATNLESFISIWQDFTQEALLFQE